MDNYAAHKTPEVRDWLAANPRVVVHFTPTHASWMNLVEVWFSIIERQAIHRGTYRSVKDLNAKIRTFIDGWNDRCHPFIWTKTADDILKKGRIPVIVATLRGVGGRDGVCTESSGEARAGAVDGAPSGVRSVDRQGVSNSEACRIGGGQSAHRDTLAVRAHGHLRFGCRAALSTGDDHHDGVVVGEVLVRG
jgi:hypothetical protein